MVLDRHNQRLLVNIGGRMNHLALLFCKVRTAAQIGCEAEGRWASIAAIANCWYCASLWFVLPFSIWFSCCWAGQIMHWQSICGEVVQPDMWYAPSHCPLFENFSQSLAGEP